MPSRRSGTRSHHGCQNCKNRHVKCDETFPTCNRCQRRNEVCTLSLRSDTITPPVRSTDSLEDLSASHDEDKPPSSTGTLSTIGIRTQLDNEWLDDMLLDHYIKVASWTLNENAQITAIYHETVPLLAKKHDHLKHALLSISGAHCVATLSAPSTSQDISPQTVQALIERSLTHQSLALNTFVRAITAAKSAILSQDESIALTLSSIFVLTSFVAHLHPAFQAFTYADVGAISKAVALLNLQGPIVVFFVQYYEQIATSELRVFLDLNPDHGTDAQVHSEQAARSLESIATLCSRSDLPPMDRDKYAEVIGGLVGMSKIIAADPSTISGRFRWVAGDTATYMADKIYQRVPEALILLAHWAACQIPNPGSWWGSGYGEALIADIEKALPPTLIVFIAWPLEQVQQVQQLQS